MTTAPPRAESEPSTASRARPALALAALGIVFGDIGTSPLYALRQTVQAAGHSAAETTLGSASLIIWALLLSTTIAYVNVILRVDNKGEGGILSLAALLSLQQKVGEAATPGSKVLLAVALAGAAMLFGDAVITPAISVLSAVEGLSVAQPGLQDLVVPIAVGVLASFFLLQVAGTDRIGALFGPVMLTWFATIGALGLHALISEPAALAALDPRHGIRLLIREPENILLVLASVFLAVTGGEALFADLGQFGRRAIALAWYAVVLPALALNYLGQAATIIADPATASDPFYLATPSVLRFPLVILATGATVIASQAVVTGIFSLVRQAGALRFLPPLVVRHTSHHNEHHVYVAVVNVLVGCASIAIVIAFKTSDRLADAYGLAVSVAMIATSILFVATLRRVFAVRWLLLAPLAAFILALDLTFVTANASKIATGGWLPLVLASAALAVAASWIRGRLRLRPTDPDEPTAYFALRADRCASVAHRTAIVLCPPDRRTPVTLVRLKRLFDLTFDRIVIVTVWVRSSPRVKQPERVRAVSFEPHITRIDVFSGYMQRTDLPSVLGPALKAHGIASDSAVYIVGHDRVRLPQMRHTLRGILLHPLDVLFLFLSRNAARPADRFNLPPRRTLELGAVHEL